MVWIIVSMIAAVLLAVIVRKIWNTHDHVKYPDDLSAIKEDAKIIDMQRQIDGAHGESVYRTTVIFDDGFEFISHKNKVKEGILTHTISITPAENKEIIDDALTAHRKAVELKKEEEAAAAEKKQY